MSERQIAAAVCVLCLIAAGLIGLSQLVEDKLGPSTCHSGYCPPRGD